MQTKYTGFRVPDIRRSTSLGRIGVDRRIRHRSQAHQLGGINAVLQKREMIVVYDGTQSLVIEMLITAMRSKFAGEAIDGA